MPNILPLTATHSGATRLLYMHDAAGAVRCFSKQPCVCQQEVAVRCGCRRLKERWQCHRVQAELKQRGLSTNGSYDGAAALRLLQCTAQCKHAKVSPCCC